MNILKFKMNFLWRRRSSVLKIVILLSAVWFTIAFLIYSEDHRPSSAGQSHNLPQSLKSEFNEIELDNNNDINGLESVINNVVINGNEKEHGKNGYHRGDAQRNGAVIEDGMYIFYLSILFI